MFPLVALDPQCLREPSVDAPLTLFAADRIFQRHKKRNVAQAKPGEAELFGVAVGAMYDSITKGHKTLRCRFRL